MELTAAVVGLKRHTKKSAQKSQFIGFNIEHCLIGNALDWALDQWGETTMTEFFGPTEIAKYKVNTTAQAAPEPKPPAQRDVDSFTGFVASATGSLGTGSDPVATAAPQNIPPGMVGFVSGSVGLLGEPQVESPPPIDSNAVGFVSGAVGNIAPPPVDDDPDNSVGVRDVSDYPYSERTLKWM